MSSFRESIDCPLIRDESLSFDAAEIIYKFELALFILSKSDRSEYWDTYSRRDFVTPIKKIK